MVGNRLELLARLSASVDKLPELYQPIFGFPEFDARFARNSTERLGAVLKIAEALTHKLERPLRVLDVGAAQGYFSMHLAKAGATVTAIEHEPASVEIMRVLQDCYPEFRVTVFERDALEFLETVEKGQFDLVLGISIFHHLMYFQGAERTVGALRRSVALAPVTILELANKSEPVYWNTCLPEEELSILEARTFVIDVLESPTHLSNVARRMYFCSDSYAYIEGDLQEIQKITSESFQGQLSHAPSRGKKQYITTEKYFIKTSLKTGDLPPITDQAERARQSVQRRSFVSGETSRFSFSYEDIVPGRTLLQLLEQGIHVKDRENICLKILIAIADLENQNIFHDDLRPWNVLVSDDSASVVDRESIYGFGLNQFRSKYIMDVFILCGEVLSGKLAGIRSERYLSLEAQNLLSYFQGLGNQTRIEVEAASFLLRNFNHLKSLSLSADEAVQEVEQGSRPDRDTLFLILGEYDLGVDRIRSLSDEINLMKKMT